MCIDFSIKLQRMPGVYADTECACITCICTCVCIMCMYEYYIHACMYMHTYLCTYTHMYVYIHTYIYILLSESIGISQEACCKSTSADCAIGFDFSCNFVSNLLTDFPEASLLGEHT